jgi:hypothetical protein
MYMRNRTYAAPGPHAERAVVHTILTTCITTYALYAYMYARVGFNTIMYYSHTEESGSQPASMSTYVHTRTTVVQAEYQVL